MVCKMLSNILIRSCITALFTLINIMSQCGNAQVDMNGKMKKIKIKIHCIVSVRKHIMLNVTEVEN